MKPWKNCSSESYVFNQMCWGVAPVGGIGIRTSKQTDNMQLLVTEVSLFSFLPRKKTRD